MIFGSVTAILAIIYRPYIFPVIQSNITNESVLNVAKYVAGINGNTMAFISSLIAITLYIVVSLLDTQPVFNLAKLLRREKRDETKPEFTKSDKVLYGIVICYTAIYFLAFVIVTLYNLFHDVPTSAWNKYWIFNVYLSITLGTIVLVWFTIGGIMDLKKLFAGLSTERIDEHDDGFVDEE
jgi:SSS family solute:Na+ symporter